MAVFQVQYPVHNKSIWGILTAGVSRVRTSNKALERTAIPCAPLPPVNLVVRSHAILAPVEIPVIEWLARRGAHRWMAAKAFGLP